jgi:hypothetical protein
MQNQKRVTKVTKTPTRQFTKPQLAKITGLIELAKDDFPMVPHAKQCECLAYHYFYLDEELDLAETVKHLEDMEIHFRALSRDKKNHLWPMHFYFAHTLNRIKTCFTETQHLKLGLYD